MPNPIPAPSLNYEALAAAMTERFRIADELNANPTPELGAQYGALTVQVAQDAMALLRAHTGEHYPTATEVLLDTNGNEGEYINHALIDADGNEVADEETIEADDMLTALIDAQAHENIEDRRRSDYWHIALTS